MNDASRSTFNNFEILCTPRTINECLASVYVIEGEEENQFWFESLPGSDLIIHVFAGEDGPEEYLHVKSGQVISRPFMYTKRYMKCRPDRHGRLKAII